MDFVVPDQAIDRTKGVRPFTFFEKGLVGHVGGQDQGVGQGLAQRGFAPAQQGQRPALGRQRAGHGPADAGAGTGDQGDTGGNCGHGFSTRRWALGPGRKGSGSPASQAAWSPR